LLIFINLIKNIAPDLQTYWYRLY